MSQLHLTGCPKEADPRNETCDCARLRERERITPMPKLSDPDRDFQNLSPPTSDFKREYESTHVAITVPDDAWHESEEGSEKEHCAPGWEGAFGIVLDTGDYVWVQASYAHGEPRGVEVVKRPTGTESKDYHDRQGNLILAVPAAWCKFYTPEEAEALEMAIHADSMMLSYARG